MDVRDAYAIRNAVNARTISAREVAETALGRIEAVDGKLAAFLTCEPEQVLARADAIDRKVKDGPLPLAGVPIAVKDNLCTRGLRTTCASKMLENWIPPYDATAVEKLAAAGAIVVGKTNCDEFAMGSSTENSAFKTTRNPYDLERIPGGSSGGSAVAVAAGMATLALGSETGGSVRQPASFCGITGLKPTYGRISRYGLVAYASSLDCVAPMGSSPRDVALLLAQVAGQDAHDSTSSTMPVPDYESEMSRPMKGMRIGITREFFGEGLNSEVKSAIETGIRNVESLGCELVDVSLPHTPYVIADYYIIATAEAGSNLARYDGVKYGYRADAPRDLLDMYQRTRSTGFGAEVRRRIMIGTYALSSGYYDAYYGRAMKVRTLIKRDYDLAFEKVDALISPVSPTPAFRIGEKSSDPLSMYLSDVYTVAANLAGIPGISIPCGFTRDGLPIGVQFLGAQFQEGALLRLAQGYLDAFKPASPALKV